MTTAFIDFPAQQQAKQQIAENVVKWTQMLIEALKQNYIQYSIRGHQRSAIACGESVDYHQRCIDELKNGKKNMMMKRMIQMVMGMIWMMTLGRKSKTHTYAKIYQRAAIWQTCNTRLQNQN